MTDPFELVYAIVILALRFRGNTCFVLQAQARYDLPVALALVAFFMAVTIAALTQHFQYPPIS